MKTKILSLLSRRQGRAAPPHEQAHRGSAPSDPGRAARGAAASVIATLTLGLALGACGADTPPPAAPAKVWSCAIPAGESPDYTREIGCQADFDTLSSLPLDISIPGARSVKFVLDQVDSDALYFQNSEKFGIHWEFASAYLSGKGKPVVPMLGQFNSTEYYSPTRRFLLGAVTYYEGPDAWTLELAPYDTASAAMITKAYKAVAAAAFFGDRLFFHPTSDAVELEAKNLGPDVPVKTTDDLFKGVNFLPLNVGSSVGRVRFMKVEDLAVECLSFRDIVVLDRVPNDLSVTLGIVTEEFQTPLSHINVLARNRHIPNMWLRDAFTNPQLRAHEDQWAKLTVDLGGFTIEPATQTEADAWWEEHRPGKLSIPPMDLSKTGLWDVTSIIDPAKPIKDELKSNILAFGGKATHYAAMAGADLVPMTTPRGFAIPVFYYDQFMTQNGFYAKIDAMLVDPTFTGGNCKERGARLEALRDEMEAAPVDPAFEKALTDKLTAEYGPVPIRYRSSSTAEDVGGFTGAGLYTSKTGTLGDVSDGPIKSVKQVWASVWYERGFEEREYRQVDQKAVGMAILAHPAFKHETASGVAQTANSYDPTGLQPAFVVNVQIGDGSVTLPGPGETTDQVIYYYFYPGQPTEYVQHSNLVPPGTSVLSRAQLYDLGQALEKIHNFFLPAYGPTATDPKAWYALEVDFKLEVPPGQAEPALFIKQARPLPSPFGTSKP